MKIKKMTASFGGLDGAVLEPGPGLTVITAPNEGGKSTWAGFLKAMLYGIDTRERDKTGFLADKTRYQPWSGAPMAGELQAEWEGSDITLRRFPTRTSPFGGFEAVYTASGDPVPGLTAANAGERLTGVGRDAYLRSAFVGQGGAAIGESRELEARISALATSGEEAVSYSAVERTLKDWRNRRRLNRANGLIPQMEEERSQAEAALREMAETRRRKEEAEQELARLEGKRRELQADLDIWARIEKHELNRRYGAAYLEWEQAKEAVPEEKPHPVFGTMTGEEAWAFAQERQRERDEALEENRRREIQRQKLELERTKRSVVRRRVLWTILALIAVSAVAVFCLWDAPISDDAAVVLALTVGFLQMLLPWLIIAAVCWGVGMLIIFLSDRRHRQDSSHIDELAPVPVPEGADWLAQAAEYREALAKAAQARAAAEAARRRVDDLAAQGGQLFDTLEMLYPPSPSKAATAAQLAAVERELDWVQKELARAEGMLAHMGVPDSLEARKSGLDGRLAQRTEEYDALTTALEALSAANDQLRQRFSPALNQKAGELFAALTGGRWDKLTLARDFSAQAGARGDALPRPSLALSTGTAEQLYLAVRLAVCQLTVPGAPLVLDDALAAFDGGRMALALDCLKTLAGERQILLFSCHDREADWARAHNVPVAAL